LFGGFSENAHVVAMTPPLKLGSDSDPVGTRISFGEDEGTIIFTFSSLTNSSLAEAYVSVGTSSGGPYTMNFTAEAATTYTASQLCHAPANISGINSYIFPGYFHTTVLPLSPGTRYYAVYGHRGSPPAPETTFRTRLVDPSKPTRFAAFGDSALYPVFPGTVTTIDSINAVDADVGEVDFTAVIGDLAYAEGSTVLWTLWAAFTFPIASRIPFLVTVGNHETNVLSCFSKEPIAHQALWQGPIPTENAYGDDCGGEGGIPTLVRYRGPNNGQGTHWYSFNAGNVHFTHFSSEHDYRAGSAQRLWLAADLASVNRSRTPWLVVAMHRPMYNSRDDGDWNINMGMRAELETLFLVSKVDLVLSGPFKTLSRSLN